MRILEGKVPVFSDIIQMQRTETWFYAVWFMSSDLIYVCSLMQRISYVTDVFLFVCHRSASCLAPLQSITADT
jgi:hypothetical protein